MQNTYGWGCMVRSQRRKKILKRGRNLLSGKIIPLIGKMFQTDKSKTLEEEYGDGDKIKPEFSFIHIRWNHWSHRIKKYY